MHTLTGYVYGKSTTGKQAIPEFPHVLDILVGFFFSLS